MSGHSKWANIKIRKEAQDKKRAQVFTKLVRAIAVSAREGGPDLAANPTLRLAVERARAFNVPKDNIERAIRREGNEAVEAFAIDAIAPGGIAMIVEGTTDNRNRTMGELRQILAKHGGKIAQEGGARWAFARRGVIATERTGQTATDDARLLTLINLGAEDVREREGFFEIIVPAESLETVRRAITDSGIPIADASPSWVPEQTAPLPEAQREAFTVLIEELNEHPDVQDVWTNETNKQESE